MSINVVLGCIAVVHATPAEDGTITKSFQVAAGGRLLLETNRGAIDVRPADTPTRLEVEVREATGSIVFQGVFSTPIPTHDTGRITRATRPVNHVWRSRGRPAGGDQRAVWATTTRALAELRAERFVQPGHAADCRRQTMEVV